MSNLIESIVTAYSVSDEKIARRVFSVGTARAEGISTEDIILEATALAKESDKTLEGFSKSTIDNANTSFKLYVSTGIPVPSLDGAVVHKGSADIARKIEAARVKHGKKIVASAIEETVSAFKSDIKVADRRQAVSDMLDALLAVDAPEKEDKSRTPEQRFLSALTAAVNLLDVIELDDEQAAAAGTLIATLFDAGIN